jgi:spore coat protein H
MVKTISFLLVLSFVSFPQQMRKIEISVQQDSVDALEAHPYADRDVHGSVVIDGTDRFDSIRLRYRGAYNLYDLMNSGEKQRNWKIKFNKEKTFRNRREWNFNYEVHLREKMAYDCFANAGVSVPSPEHVLLYVNGDYHGLYLAYEDPDDKSWLQDAFGDNSGDLYKAAHDMPDEPSYFALLTDLGDSSSDYYYHYDKKTNNDSTDSSDYRCLITFIKLVNYTPKESFPDSLKKYFDVKSFIRYLAVSNFIINWDSYPTRPKNYWLYYRPSTHRWSFIPWDLDATFHENLSGMGTTDPDLSIFSQLDKYEPHKGQPNEGTERPLTRRMMEYGEFRNGYIGEYKTAIESYLGLSYLNARIDSLTGIIRHAISGDELDVFNKSVGVMKEFVAERHKNVKQQLDSLSHASISARPPSRARGPMAIHASSSASVITLSFRAAAAQRVTIVLMDIAGRKLSTIDDRHSEPVDRVISFNTPRLNAGVYIIDITFGEMKQYVRRLVAIP